MENKAYIKAISYYLPEAVLTNEDISKEFPEWTVEKIASKIGVNQRHIAAPDETALDMAQKSSEKLIQEYNIDKSEIDFVLLCTQSADYLLPASACLLQDRLELSTKCGALDFNLGCSGFVYGLSLAKGLIAANIAHNVLLVTSETYSKYIHPKDKKNRTIFGDASTATLISKDGFAEIGEFVLRTDGAGLKSINIKSGAARNPIKTGKIILDESDNLISDDYLYMNGADVFNFTLSEVPSMFEEVLLKNKKNLDEIDLVIFHQANQYMLEFLRKKIKISSEIFFYYMENVGNSVSSSIPIALKEAQKQKKLKGDIVIAGFGVGYSSGSVILTCK